MYPLVSRFVLALALLMSQTAVAVHDIQCLDGDHDHTCEVYFTQDHNADSDGDKTQAERLAYGEEPVSSKALSSPSLFDTSYLSRAPPKRS